MIRALLVCAAILATPALAADAPAPVKPLQIIGLEDCGTFIGTIIVMPDGQTTVRNPRELPIYVAEHIAVTLGPDHNTFVRFCAAIKT